MKELKDLVVGDDVLIISRNYRRIAKVDKVTKTQIVVDNTRLLGTTDDWEGGEV